MSRALSTDLDTLLTAARIALPCATKMERTKAEVEDLQAQIASVTAQIKLVQASLASEKAAFAEWRRKALDDKSLSDTGDELELRGLSREIEATQTALREIHNQLAKGRDEVERLSRECRRCERLIEHPPRIG
jgi:predicted  nucleic acid-binding Zn-ribbon protein